ncbi:glycoside hydrolase family 2 TIM barrel-domain containing protein [Phycisphaera mikurensis]|uniref:Putative glycoside hydrolase n=1 Tax=Phycisphaera mikurensis (strain NBRC 102666 / KCTC 22515 / FYK2301M01) TaxID=1142394 RepID=I0ID13_PHYMF|nr:glycoside hydrolase family 2 TIM barrel-domain containing protein [Phycisphaera mikurensis]MBB6442276.1 beta-galactosidase [Phycisphaera mikurensis]BAM03151.1 putative glycoside hydrolase [Phycisphaera mikurensis NBRC 102666]
MIPAPRHRFCLDTGWRFSLDDPDAPRAIAWSDEERSLLGFEPELGKANGVVWSKAGKCYGPAAAGFDASGWRSVDLPHDWSVERAPDPAFPLRNGFLAMGIGWYHRPLRVDPAWAGKRVTLRFDGIYRDATVFANGHVLAFHRSGYLPLEVDLSDVLDFENPEHNAIAVRVDASEKEGWFYEGCGIHRHAWLTVTDPVHLVTDGVFAQVDWTPGEAASVGLWAEVGNAADRGLEAEVEHAVRGAGGELVAVMRAAVFVEPGGVSTTRQALVIDSPRPWGPEDRHRYRVTTRLRVDGRVVDAREDRFGVRHVAFDAATGMKLNGEPLKLKGVCCHPDHAGVGSALPDDLQVWRLEKLRELGCNAYRAAHNPPTPEVLEACDRLGILVIDEARVFGVGEEHLGQLESMIRRDRNHPCVILWSLANEEMQVQCTPVGARMLKTALRRARRLDATRGFTTAVNTGWDGEVGFIEHADVHGINYFGNGDIDELRRVRPDVPVILSEGASAICTRGAYANDPAAGYVAEYDDHTPPPAHPQLMQWPHWGRCAGDSWRQVAARADVAGTFVWTGFDYRGEQTPYQRWPGTGSHFGIYDSCGFPKDGTSYYRAWWSGEPVLHVFPHWSWPGREGETIDVWAYSNAATVELFCNGRSCGERSIPRNGHASWPVPYEAGELSAVARWADGSERRAVVETAGPAVGLRLERVAPELRLATTPVLAGDPQPRTLGIVQVAVVDAAGRTVPTAMDRLTFSLDGGAVLLGLGNGDPNADGIEAPRSATAERGAFHGLAQALVGLAAGTPAVLRVAAPGLEAGELLLDAETAVSTAAPRTERVTG